MKHFRFCSCLIVWHPCSHRKDDAVLVKSLLLQVTLQKPQLFPSVALSFLSQFSCPLLFVGSYPERHVFYLVIVISPKLFWIFLVDCLRPSSLCVILFYCLHTTWWYIFSTDSFLATHFSYSFNLYPLAFNVCVKTLYHCSANSIHPYIAFISLNFSTSLPFSYLTYCLYSLFISHMMSKKWPLGFRILFYPLSSWRANMLLERQK